MSVRVAEIPTEEERARQMLADERDHERSHRFDVAIFLVQCICSCVVGLLLVGYAMHTIDMRWARISFWGGLTLGNAGILQSLVRYYGRAQGSGGS